MKEPLKILMLENSATDAELVQRLLKKEKLPIEFNLATNKGEFLLALDQFQPDIILADNSLPQFNATEALEIIQQRSDRIPFIMVTGTVSEEFAAKIIKSGADDYILKDRMGRLPAAIKAASQKKKSERTIKHNEEINKLIMNSSLDAIVCIDTTGAITVWNSQAEKMFGWKEQEIIGKQLVETIIPVKYRHRHSNGLAHYIKTGEGPVLNRVIEISALSHSGNEFPIELAIVPIKQNDGEFFCAFIRDITERKKAEEELHQINEELRSLSSHLQNVREEERMQIARDIHDDLGQQLTGLKMDVNWLNKKLETEDEIVKQKMKGMIELIDETVKSIRKISWNLRPSILDDLGLIAALEWHSEEMEKRSEIKVNFYADITEPDIPLATATGIFRIYQEVLTNAIRHANAHKITSCFQIKDNWLNLEIKDDGQGMDTAVIRTKKTLGLIGVKERTFVLGGKYDLQSEPGKGTKIKISIPYKTKS